MKKRFKQTDAAAPAPLLIFTIFAACILIVLLFGANIYQMLDFVRETISTARLMVRFLVVS